MTSSAADGGLGAWLRRLPSYLYLVDLLPGKRVLEVGCGTGYGAQFLADHGAGRVVGVDRSLRNISDARARYRQTNLEFRCEEPGTIELDDASFDCIFVPDGIDVLRRISVLGELRRLLARDGYLVLLGPSADRRGSPGGASFHEFRERLERSFAPVRMVAQTPFVGFSLVEYGTGAADEQTVDTQLDTSLLEFAGAEPEPSDYVAVCGGAHGPPRGYTLVQVPVREGIDAAAASVGMVLAARAEGHAGEREAAAGAVEEHAPALPSRPGRSAGEGGRDALLVHELTARLETATSERAAAQAQAGELRAQAEELRAEATALRAEATALRAESSAPRAEATALGAEPTAPRAEATAPHALDREPASEPASEKEEPGYQLGAAAELTESRPAAGPSPSEQIAEALSAHRAVVRSLEIAVEEGEAYAEELRAELEQAAAQAAAEAAGRLRAEAWVERLEGELREWRTRASSAEGKLLRLAGGDDGQEAPDEGVEVAPAAPQPLDAGAAAAASATDDGRRVLELEEELARAQGRWRDADAEIAALRAELAEKRERRDGNGDGGLIASAAAPAASAAVGRDVARNLARLELEIESGRSLIQQVESGLAELEQQVARDATERAPSAWAAHRDQQLRELSAELGIKDAEIMILHIGVSALRARMRELIGDVRRTAVLARQRPVPEALELVDQLSERAASFEEREETAGS